MIRTTRPLRQDIEAVVASDNCSGCGVCALLDGGIEMKINAAGYLRPVPAGPSDEIPRASAIFTQACPGRRVRAQQPSGSSRDRLLGSTFGIWEAWATDPEIRWQGSSGGVLTALQAWMLESGMIERSEAAAMSAQQPTRTVPVTVLTRRQALDAAGSRYAPVSVAQNARFDESEAVVTKPCEASALRAAADAGMGPAPVLLSFFCAGTPSQHATDALVEKLGARPGEVTSLWYRGRGWPGEFTASTPKGEVSTDYNASWGDSLGPTVQWRCKICPDGVGEAADIVAADSWETDERGYPQFDERDGRSALIARTSRGLAIIQAAIAAGIIEARPLQPEHLHAAQPLQTGRRRFLAARLAGAKLAGQSVPRFSGFGLLSLAASNPRQAIRVLRGTNRRIRARRSQPR